MVGTHDDKLSKSQFYDWVAANPTTAHFTFAPREWMAGLNSFINVKDSDNGIAILLGMMSAAASLGLVLLWDIDGGLSQLDKYLYSKEDYIKV